MADTRWMTYAELAEGLGIGLDSAKNLARRKRWGRQRGNDGLARIGVPSEVLDRRPKPMPPVAADAPVNAPIDAPTSPPIDGPTDGPSTLDILHRHIERLEVELAAQRAEREAMRERSEGLTSRLIEAEKEASAAPVLRESVEALKAALHSERLLRDELRRELDLARRPWWRRLAG
jgi:hypothetical protein